MSPLASPSTSESPEAGKPFYVQGTGQFVFQSAFRLYRVAPPPKARPPPFRRAPPPAVKLVHTPEMNFMSVVCRKIINPQGYAIDDPNCDVPVGRVASGAAAVELREREKILNGDEVKDLLELSTRPDVDVGGAAVGSRRLLANASESVSVSKMRVQKFSFTKKGSQKEIYTGQPIDLRTVVYLIDLQCSTRSDHLLPIRSPAEVYAYLFPDAATPVRNNLQKYYSTCSYGKTLFQRQNTVVLGPIKVACKGTFPVDIKASEDQDFFTRYPNATGTSSRSLSGSWDFLNFCGPSEQRALQDAGEAFARNAAETDPAVAAVMSWTQRRRAVFMIPPRNRCAWAGLADVSCTSPVCNSYLRVADKPDMQILYHELMHNYGLSHATHGLNEYGDSTDAMGNFTSAGSNLLCHNAPYLYRIGWAKPINGGGSLSGEYGNLTAANFTVESNTVTGLRLPAQGTSDENMVVVALGSKDSRSPGSTADGLDPPYPTYFLSYRIRNTTAGGYDSGLNSSFNTGKIVIHEYNGVQDERDLSKSRLVDFGPTWRKPAPDDPKSWMSPFAAVDEEGLGGAFKLSVARLTSTFAEVDLCRVFALNESDIPGGCVDGVDNDCDGLPDGEDEDCQ